MPTDALKATRLLTQVMKWNSDDSSVSTSPKASMISFYVPGRSHCLKLWHQHTNGSPVGLLRAPIKELSTYTPSMKMSSSTFPKLGPHRRKHRLLRQRSTSR